MIPELLTVVREEDQDYFLIQLQLLEYGEKLSEEQETAILEPIREKYEREGSPYYSTARLWDDGIIDPVDTRSMVGLGIAASLNAPFPEPKRGVFRM